MKSLFNMLLSAAAALAFAIFMGVFVASIKIDFGLFPVAWAGFAAYVLIRLDWRARRHG